jgi:cytochrome P450
VVSVQNYAAYHHELNFRRPDDFIPERFLSDPDFASDNREVLQPFSVGPRNCIGRNLAYLEMRLILAKVVYNFELELDEARTGDWAHQKAFLLWDKRPLWVRIKPAAKARTRTS